jgi:sec-independent protein translocase protein TatB
MLGLGWTEMLVVAAVALIVVGPRDLPAMLRQLGRTVGTLRRMSNEFRAEFNKMAAMDEIRDVRKTLSDPLHDARKQYENQFHKAGSPDIKPDTAKPDATKPDAGGQSEIGTIKTLSGVGDVPSELMGEASAGAAAAKPAAKAKRGRKPPSGTATAKPVEATDKAATAAKPAARPKAAKSAKSAGVAAPKSKTAAKPKKTAKSKTATKPVSTATAKGEKTTPSKPARRRPSSEAAKV